MREINVEALATSSDDTVIPTLLTRHLDAGRNPALFARQDSTGAWLPVSAQAFTDDARAVAKGLVARGVQPGDSVALMSRNRYEWSLLDFAILFAGGVTVPVYETSSPSQVAWILSDSRCGIIVTETEAHASTVKRAARDADLSGLRDLMVMDNGDLDSLRADGARISDAELSSRTASRRKTDTATIIYTSGTTGRPKGCALTHANFVDLSDNALAILSDIVNERASTLMFLPLAHVFARYIAILAVAGGAMVGHVPDLKNLVPDMQSFKPTFLLAVPRVFEKVFNGALQNAQAGGKEKIFMAAARTAAEYSRASLSGEGRIPLGLKLKHAVFDKLVYSKVRQATGGRVAHAVSGGGPLGERLGHFFNGVGITVLEGYGLTETTAPVGVNTPERIKIGTVGRPLPGNAYRIADDGEILAKGVCIFKEYINRPDLTEEAFDGEWFRTGDLGSLDEDGFLTITGRKKEIIVTAGGKNVAPAMLEDQIRAAALVSQCIVVGEGRKFVGALVTLDEEVLPAWLKRHELPEDTPLDSLLTHPQVLEDVQAAVDAANQSVSHAEAIKKFSIVGTDFSEEAGHLTPSLKMRRQVILKDFAADVDALYS
ncbi:MAG: AMP-dependent synthetase/ligase [Galactobacter sp.]